MGKNQGFKRLLAGYRKIITKSESNRGYFFISHDKKAQKCFGSDLKIYIKNSKPITRKIDSSGRIILGVKMVRRFDGSCFIKMEDGGNIIIN